MRLQYDVFEREQGLGHMRLVDEDIEPGAP